MKKKKTRFNRNNLTKNEKKIYDSIMKSFPKTSSESAYDYAVQGGLKFQFYPK